MVEMNDDCLFDAQHAQRLHLLIEGLQKRRCGLSMEHGTWMRFEGDDCRNSVSCSCSVDNCFHDQLMAEVEPIKYPECQHGRALNRSVISAMKKSHISSNERSE